MTQKLTPAMQQYMDIKNKHEDCIVLFRMGDFYETFYDDAKTCARELEITLTSRGKGATRAPLAGIPYHSIDPYIAKLVKKGYKVAIVEQTEDPKKAKGIVKRDLVRIITPGTVVESMILDEGTNNYIASVSFSDQGRVGLSWCDVSTGEFLTQEYSDRHALNEILRIHPAEIIYPSMQHNHSLLIDLQGKGIVLHEFEDRFYFSDKAKSVLLDHFDVLNLEGFGVEKELCISSAGALVQYLKKTQLTALAHINSLQMYNDDNIMHLDRATITNLELVRNVHSRGENATLLSVLDKTVTSMGKRLLRRWVLHPLTDRREIEKRLQAVDELKTKVILRDHIVDKLKAVYDIERLVGRVSYGSASPKDLVALGGSLVMLPKLVHELKGLDSSLISEIREIPDLGDAAVLISNAIKDDPNTTVREGNIIREGYNKEVDELRAISKDAKKFLSELEEKERIRTGIKSLKIKYNKVFGYYIEVTKANLKLVPKEYVRKQTQVNSERFITDELKEKEAKILGAQERLVELEFELFMSVISSLAAYVKKMQDAARKVAVLDCIVSLSVVAHANKYCMPVFDDTDNLDVVESRHAVIEAFSKEPFIPNDVSLTSANRMMIITGPNMAGKSTVMRQVALLCVMAQIGSFVPASRAVLPVFDRVFLRVGAHDDLVSGQSTFMVEMNEAANILHNATPKSFIVLDEIGRGTSTYDGVSLAWSIAEYIHTTIKAKTMFATHYHQLNKLAEQYDGIMNYNIAVAETDDKIVFLRKLVAGGTDKSYGIQVAKLAGVPEVVVSNAKKIMSGFESEDVVGERFEEAANGKDVETKGKRERKTVSLRDFF